MRLTLKAVPRRKRPHLNHVPPGGASCEGRRGQPPKVLLSETSHFKNRANPSVKSGCSFNCLIGHVFLNPQGFRPWQLAEEHGLALERQAEEHHRSEAEQNHPRPTAATCVNSNTFGRMRTK